MQNKNLYKIRITSAIIIFIIAVIGMLGIFYPLNLFDIQFLPVLQRVLNNFSITPLLILIALILLTLIFGRIYCSLICPLGILQEIIGFIKNKTSDSVHKNYPLKYFLAAVVWGIFIGGSSLLIRYIDPYTIFGSAISKTSAGLIIVGLIILAVFFKDRIFCTNFCPVGTILGLISKISFNKIYISDVCVSCGQCEKNCPAACINSKEKTVDNETCIKCLKCLEICPKNGIKYGKTPPKAIKFDIKRRQLIIASTALALFGIMTKAGLELKEKITEKIKDVILPPGAENKEKFLNKCLNCNLCIENCPNKIIKKADNEYPAVHIDYSKSFCKFDCNECSKICPSGAIKRINKKEKQQTRIAMAMINEEKCDKCGRCIEACPKHAIIKENGMISLNAAKCIGCGACKNICTAIEIFPIKEQKLI